MTTAILILGNQLFPTHFYKDLKIKNAFMAEDNGLCTHFKYHKHKIILFLASMRKYADELNATGLGVHYERFNKKSSFEDKLIQYIKKNKIKTMVSFEVEDKFFENRLKTLFKSLKVEWEIKTSPMFICSRKEFKNYLKDYKKPFMKTFYERQRRALSILMDENNSPEGGSYSYDDQNRKRLPKKITLPKNNLKPPHCDHVLEIIKLVDREFKDHPGDGADFWLATDREQALKIFDQFLKEKLENFGSYQDAITNRDPFLFHSIISPYINMGMLIPEEIVSKTLEYYYEYKPPLNSVEGFIRQVMGWREFLRGIYQNFDHEMTDKNFWNHTRKLKECWWTGDTGIEVIDYVIKKTIKYGYAHHIERLMVISNIMLTLQVDPKEVYRWFMEMFVDSSDWVMVPNVYGMGQFSDGGIFATKPYISGSNYLMKMGDFSKGPWCDAIDGLYWNFIEHNLDFYKSQPRMSMMVSLLEKIPKDKKKRIFQAAADFQDKVTYKA